MLHRRRHSDAEMQSAPEEGLTRRWSPTDCPRGVGNLNLTRPPLSRLLLALRAWQEPRQRLDSSEVRAGSRQSVAQLGR
jgi:hypothetical protein